MNFKVPGFEKCCFYVPLRYGILIFGYLNLIVTLCVTGIQGFAGYVVPTNSLLIYRAFEMYRMRDILCLFEIFFNIVLVVGAHMKKTYLLKIYYYYGIIATTAAFISFFIMTYDDQRDVEYLYVYIFVAIAGLVYNVYLLLLIRAEMQKLYLQHEEFYYKNKNSDVMLELPNPWDDAKTPLNKNQI